MTDLEQACTDLAAWLPAVAVLLHQPDTDPSTTRTAPHSTPPWNTANAHPFFDALEGIRRIHASIRLEVTGRTAPLPPYAVTGATLTAIPRLATAASQETVEHATWQLTCYTTIFLQLPAVDLEPRPRRLAQPPCPRCERKMLTYRDWTGQVACVGCKLSGTLTMGAVSGEPIFMWELAS